MCRLTRRLLAFHPFARVHRGVIVAQAFAAVPVVDLHGIGDSVLVHAKTMTGRPADLLQKLMADVRSVERRHCFV